jgi:hypothetical protein
VEKRKEDEIPTRSPVKVRFTGVPKGKDESDDDDDDDDDEEEEESKEENNDEQKEREDARKPRGHRHEDREAKKVCRPSDPVVRLRSSSSSRVWSLMSCCRNVKRP